MASETKVLKASEIVGLVDQLDQYDFVKTGKGAKPAKEIEELHTAFKDVFGQGKAGRKALDDYKAVTKELEAFQEKFKGKFKVHGDHLHLEKDVKVEEVEGFEAMNAKFKAANENLVKAMGDKGEKIEQFGKKLGSPLGLLKTEGLVETAKHNLTKFDKRAGQAFGRCGGTAICAVGMGDALFRSKTNDGEDRSVVTRFGEFAICALGAGALVLAGKAHMPALAKA